MLARINAKGFQRLQIKLLRVARIRFEDHLELIVLLKTVGVLSVTAIIRADGGFNVSHAPGLRTQHAQEGGRVHGTRTYLGVIGLPDQTAVVGPEFL
ncbi:hypothetical protein SDC9_105213 [bioreactor metagenome]|uniref:Uncharacterized protein n=1 Tax=bioreactor metagenome TaxID=1076179 RepID=A0A645AYW7_9ZZZZ